MRTLTFVLMMMLAGSAAAGPLDDALSGLPGYKEAAQWRYEQELARQRIERMKLENELLREELLRRQAEQCRRAAAMRVPGEVYSCD